MITLEETSCPSCQSAYSASNVPRLLTMCGHTFCESCIKKLIDKKKVNGKFRVTCPTDKKFMEINSVSASFFPKNLSVLEMAKKKR